MLDCNQCVSTEHSLHYKCHIANIGIGELPTCEKLENLRFDLGLTSFPQGPALAAADQQMSHGWQSSHDSRLITTHDTHTP